MLFTRFDIPGPVLIEPKRIGDERGFFSEVFRNDLFQAHVGPFAFVQDNHSRTSRKGTLRGLHYQKNPRAQGKLMRVTRGSVYDVAVDIRTGSPSYGRCVSVQLSAANWKQLWVPPGFLHGFCALEDDVEVLYKVTDHYSAEHDAAVRWNDPTIAIPWPVAEADVILSDKDRNAPLLADVGQPFTFA
jgi:dTDP-4-dehydrorhamnose 3,5-epimerase